MLYRPIFKYKMSLYSSVYTQATNMTLHGITTIRTV